METEEERSRIATLRDLLCQSLTIEELQRIVGDAYGYGLLNELPMATVSYIDYCHHLALALERRGLVNERFFTALLDKLPARESQVAAVGQRWGIQICCSGSGLRASSRSDTIAGFDRIAAETIVGDSTPQRFYLGYPATWGDLAAHVDIYRSIIRDGARVSYHGILATLQKQPVSHLFMVFGEAGSGKTTFLRRLMCDLVHSGHLVHRAYQNSRLNISEVHSYATRRSSSPTYLFVDDGQSQALQLLMLADELAAVRNDVIIVAAARKNEWNLATRASHLSQYEELYLPSLTADEASSLIAKLSSFNSLGQLEQLTPEARLNAVREKASSQLLVGLLEATHGKRFRELVLDEFKGIANEDARLLYLSICLVAYLGLSLPEEAAAMIARAESRLGLHTSILPLLELVVRCDEFNGIRHLLPRHRVIGDELLTHFCPSPDAKLSAGYDILDRFSGTMSPNPRIQLFAARICQRLLRKRILSDSAAAVNTVDKLLRAGVGSYVWGAPVPDHFLTPQHLRNRGHSFYHALSNRTPGQVQFRTGATILRKLVDDDSALQLIQEGLSLCDSWHELRLYQATIEYERGHSADAEQLIERVVTLADQGELGKAIVLPIALATEIALLKQASDPKLALRYLIMAERNLRANMSDVNRYFATKAALQSTLVSRSVAMATLDMGLKLVTKPDWVVADLERKYLILAVEDDPDRAELWIRRRYPDVASAPSRARRALISILTMRRDTAAIRELVANSPVGRAHVASEMTRCLTSNDSGAFEYLRAFLESAAIDDPVLARPLLERAVRDRDREGVLKALQALSKPEGAVLKQLRRYDRKNDIESAEFLRSVPRERKAAPGTVASLRKALEAGDAEAMRVAFLQCDDAVINNPVLARPLLERAIRDRDRDGVLKALHAFSKPDGAVLKQLRRYDRTNDIESAEFLRSVCPRERQTASGTVASLRKALEAGDAEAMHDDAAIDNPVLARPLLERAVRDRDRDGVLKVLQALSKPEGAVLKQLRRYDRTNDIESAEFLRSVCPRERQTASGTVASLRKALEAGDAEATRVAFVQCGDRRQLIRCLLSQWRDQPLSSYQFLEDTLGIRAILSDRAALELLKHAIEGQDCPLALEALFRAQDFRTLLAATRAEFGGCGGGAGDLLETLADQFCLTGEDLATGFTPLQNLTQFRAVGIVHGSHTAALNGDGGVLVTDDGATLRATHRPELSAKLQSQADALGFVTCRVYPKYDEREDVLSFTITAVESAHDPNRASHFSVRGMVSHINASGSFAIVSIMPNEPWASDQGPTVVRIDGVIPPGLEEWFCSIHATLVGTRLQAVKVDPIIRMP